MIDVHRLSCGVVSDLRALGVGGDVIAVTSIARSDSDKKRKSDRRDVSPACCPS